MIRRIAVASVVALAAIGGVVVGQARTTAPVSDLEYVVAQSGDNYYRLARDLGLSCNGTELWAANGRAPLDPGTIVFVPPSCREVPPVPTTVPPTVPPTTTPPPPPTTVPPTTQPPTVGVFPTALTAGVPAGWVPKQTVNGLNVTTAGAVIEDVRVNGTITVSARNVTLRRVEVVGGTIRNFAGSTCNPGLLIEDSTIRKAAGQTTTDRDIEAVGVGGYTARNVKIDGLPEGFRVGGKSSCGPVAISDSWLRITSPDVCPDWHGDGIQGYDGGALTVRNTYIELVERGGCGGTAPFFYPANQGNTSVDIDGLIVKGGGYSFRSGMPGPVRNLHIVDRSWGYGPIAVNCSKATAWSASISTLDGNGQPVPVRSQPCNTESGT